MGGEEVARKEFLRTSQWNSSELKSSCSLTEASKSLFQPTLNRRFSTLPKNVPDPLHPTFQALGDDSPKWTKSREEIQEEWIFFPKIRAIPT